MAPENRINPVTTADAANNARLKPVSPTGSPVLSPRVVPWATLVVGIAGIGASAPFWGIPVPPIISGICWTIVTIGAAFGISSPGIRRHPESGQPVVGVAPDDQAKAP